MHRNGIWGKLFRGVERVIDLSEITSLRQLYILSFLSWELGLNRWWDWLKADWLMDWLILSSHTILNTCLGARRFFWGDTKMSKIEVQAFHYLLGGRLEKCTMKCGLWMKGCRNALGAWETVGQALPLRIRDSFMEVVIFVSGLL